MLLRGGEIDVDALLARGFVVPLGQAIAAEARENHELDVLHIPPLVEMSDQAAQDSGVESVSGGGIHGYLLLEL
jgi:hypothetical protein